jgi:multidrug efflux system membrane fusion protein
MMVQESRPQTRPQQQVSKKPSGQKWLIIGAISVLLLGGIVWLTLSRKAASKAKAAAAVRAGQAPVPVVAGKVGRKDVPIYLDGLGTVQAFNTVTVRARVDGQLQKVGFAEGQDVRAGDLLAQIDPEPFRTQVAQAVAKMGQDAAQLANAQIDFKREAALLAAKIDSQQVYDTAEALVNQLDAAVKADEAAIDSAQVQLNYTIINSPIDGRTGIRVVDQGNIVHATDTNGLVVITQLKPISVIFTLPEQTLGGIHKQMESGELSVLAVDRDNSTTLDTGKLSVVDNQIDTTTGTIKLKAEFPNEHLRLWPGQFVNARLQLTTSKDAIVVPAQVIQRGPDGAFAFVIKEDGTNGMTAETRPVTVTQIEDGQALIEKGLDFGETVVVDGQYRLQDGTKVKPAPAGKSAGGKLASGSPAE